MYQRLKGSLARTKPRNKRLQPSKQETLEDRIRQRAQKESAEHEMFFFDNFSDGFRQKLTAYAFYPHQVELLLALGRSEEEILQVLEQEQRRDEKLRKE